MSRSRRWLLAVLPLLALLPFTPVAHAADAGTLGYYRFPSVRGNTVVFTAEGDLWKVGLEGGVAQRLTSHLGEESRAAISPDGRWVAFSAAYDGPVEAYVMPLVGGLPKRLTYDGLRAVVMGWTPKGEVLLSSRRTSLFPAGQLHAIDPTTGARRVLPLAQAWDGAWLGETLVFTRQEPNISHTRRYRGGTIQQLWTWSGGRDEAQRLMPTDSAASRTPMVWQDRIYFVGDRSLDMNLWSVKPDGSDAKQHTFHKGWDVRDAAMDAGRIVYQLGADLRVYDVAKNEDRALEVRLASDLDQTRERWISDPLTWVSAAHVSPNGDRVVLTARGQVFVVPLEDGRLVQVTHDESVRWRSARFMPDGKSVAALSDATGEVEWWTLPANGVGGPRNLSKDAKTLRFDGVPSPDGKFIASTNKEQELWLLEVATGRHERIVKSEYWDDPRDLTWSPDSRFLAFTRPEHNLLTRIFVYDTQKKSITAATSERWDSSSPAWSPDGKWLWFLSDRRFDSVVRSIWGSRQPEPFFDEATQIYGLALQKGTRSPWAKLDELQGGDKPAAKPASDKPVTKGDAKAETKSDGPAPVVIDWDGLAERLVEVPAGPGNYGSLTTDGKRLYFTAADAAVDAKPALMSYEIARKAEPATALMSDIERYELSADGKKLMVKKTDGIFVFDAGGAAPAKLDKAKLPLAGWSFTFDPRIEWRQMFTEAWRLERDYFYDRDMHGVDWNAQLTKFKPLAERVTSRAELSDLFQQLIGELSALHMYVNGGDMRRGTDSAEPASLGAAYERDAASGGFRLTRVYTTDPDEPSKRGPLFAPGVDVKVGDVITAINGQSTRDAVDPGALLRGLAGKQVLLRVKRGSEPERDAIVTPVPPARETDLRYTEWEYTRRLRTDSLSAGRVGYVHLRAMGAADMAQWQRDFFPVFHRDGLVIDLRGNRGGNIDAWILSRLLRKAWMYWQPRSAEPVANMPFAFTGRMAVIVNETTVSDGEAFAEGFRRLGLGKVVGSRTWGGEIWLSQDNILVDRGIATAAETGVYGPEGTWLIEGHGVDPDVVVDNLPRATADGHDAQLDAAVKLVLEEAAKQPRKVPPAPSYPDKSGRR